MSQSTLTSTTAISLTSQPEHPPKNIKDGVLYRKINKVILRPRNSLQLPSCVWQYGQTYGVVTEEMDVNRAMRCHHCQSLIELHVGFQLPWPYDC